MTTRLDRAWLIGRGIFAGFCLGMLLFAAVFGKKAEAQDATTDLSLLMRGVIPRVSVTVDSATTFAISPRFPWAYVLLACTGAETIQTITGGRQGTILIIENTDTDCTLDDDDAATAADAIDLTGSDTDVVGAAAKFIALIYNGTHWSELYESDN